jgi:GMP synthase-like glutamine amidotransferase
MKTPEIGVLKVSITNNNSLFKGLNKELKVLQWHSYEVCDLPSNTSLLASSPECKVQAFSSYNAFGLQFHVEQTHETVPQWACVPEYKSALEKTLGSNALEKFKNDVKENLKLFNNSAKTIYENFKKVI